MTAVTILPRRERRLSKLGAALIVGVVAVAGVSAALVADAGAAPPPKKSCNGKGCAKGATPTPTATADAAPTPTTSPSPSTVAAPATTSPVTTSPSPTPTASDETESTGTWVSPEGATISVDPDVAGWTPRSIYDVLQRNAYQLGLIGPHLTVIVSLDGYNSTSTGAASSAGVYTGYSATISLNGGPSSSLNTNADRLIAHEYGHAWSLYHLYMTHAKDWTPYLDARGLTGNPKLDTTLSWDRKELIADDYRMLFGTDAAVSGMAYLNRELPDPRTVAGLKSFLADSWASG
jgi:hypothetical protein